MRCSNVSFFALSITFTLSFFHICIAQSQYAGTYSNQQFTVELKQTQANNFTGNVSGNEGSFPLQANLVSQNNISGSYNYYGQKIPFTGYFQQNQLVISSEGEQFVLKKQTQSSPMQNANAFGGQQNNSAGYQEKEATWGIAYTTPAGWASQIADGVRYFISPDQKKIIVLFPDTESTSLQELREGAKAGIVEGATRLMPQGNAANFGNDGVSVPLSGTFNGKQAKGYAIGRLSPYKSGAVMVGVSETADYNTSFENEIKSFAKKIQFFAPQRATDDNGNVADWGIYMKGRKLARVKSDTGFYMEIYIYLCSDGSFKYTDNSGGFGGGASITSNSADTGRWQAYGKGNSGQLILNFSNGSTKTYNTKLESDGLYLNGTRYYRDKNELCN